MKDVKLWFAYNENQEVIKINDADINKTYFCPCCGADVFPKATKSKKVSMHFCHVSGESCSNNGGESYIHKWIKTVLFTPNQVIKINTKDGIKEYTVKEVEIEKRYETSQGDYIPDISILTYEGEKMFAEIYNTNKKSIKKYWLKWFELGNTVIEIAVDDIINKDLNSMVLEPIYEDSDRFRNFEESDYKGLIGKKVNDEERVYVKKLYNDIYNYINNKSTIVEICKYSERSLKKYVCSSVLEDILIDIDNYKKILGECVNEIIKTEVWKEDCEKVIYKYSSTSYPNVYHYSRSLLRDYWTIIKMAKGNRLGLKFERFIKKERDDSFYLNKNNKEINRYLSMYEDSIKKEIGIEIKNKFTKIYTRRYSFGTAWGRKFKLHPMPSHKTDFRTFHQCWEAKRKWNTFLKRLYNYKNDCMNNEAQKIRFVKKEYKKSHNRDIEFCLNGYNKEINEILGIYTKIHGESDKLKDCQKKVDFIEQFYRKPPVGIYGAFFIDGYEDECKKILSIGIEDYIYKLENFTYKSNRD